MSLAKLLGEQSQRLEALTDLLEAERELLVQAGTDGQALEQIAAQKRERLAQLESAEALRQRVQQRLGYVDGIEGARRAAEDADCLALWEQTLEQAREVQRLNALNGQLIDQRLQHNAQLLEFIHQAAEKTLYGASGRVGAQPGRISTSV